MTGLEKKLSQMTPEQRKAAIESIGNMMALPGSEWIVSCNPNIYAIDDAFRNLGNIEWQIGRYKIEQGDILYIYVGHTDKALRYKCVVVSDKRMATTIDDSWYGGNEIGVEPYPCVEIKPIGYYHGDGIRYEDLLKHGLKGSIRGPIKASGDLLNYIKSINVRDFRLKEQDDLKAESHKLSDDIKGLTGYDIEAVVKARRNQGLFRSLLMDKYDGRCCLCGLDNRYLLVASHIKPWRDSTDKEKVSIHNGLLLCPNHDKLFDSGFISFDDDGRIMISSVELDEKDCKLLNINKDMKIDVSDEQKPFLKYHRENIFASEE